MKHEKIIKREDGTQIKIEINFSVDWYSISEANWITTVYCRAPRKQKWLVWDKFYKVNYPSEYYKWTTQEKQKWYQQEMLKFVSAEEILQAKMELWEKLKPE